MHKQISFPPLYLKCISEAIPKVYQQDRAFTSKITLKEQVYQHFKHSGIHNLNYIKTTLLMVIT